MAAGRRERPVREGRADARRTRAVADRARWTARHVCAGASTCRSSCRRLPRPRDPAPGGRAHDGVMRLIVAPERCIGAGESAAPVGPLRAALRRALGAQLGHGRLHRSRGRSPSGRRRSAPATVGVNPLHALFPAEPTTSARTARPAACSSTCSTSISRRCPTSPSAGGAGDAGAMAASRPSSSALRAAELVDYPAVARSSCACSSSSSPSFRAHHLAALERARARVSRVPSASWARRSSGTHSSSAAGAHAADRPGLGAGRSGPSRYRDPGAPRSPRFARAHARARRVLRVPAVAGRRAARRRRRRARGPRACRSGSIRTSRSR